MSTDHKDELALVCEHLRTLEPPPGTKTRVVVQLEEQIAGHGPRKTGRWVLGLGVALLTGVTMAATKGTWWSPTLEPKHVIEAPMPKPPPAPKVMQQSNPAPLTPPQPPPTQVEDSIEEAPSPKHRRSSVTKQEKPKQDDALALQVAQLQAALAYAKRDDGRALRELRAFKQRWPKSALGHEADIEIVAALRRLGRQQESRSAARDFVQSHPESAKAQEMEALAQEVKP